MAERDQNITSVLLVALVIGKAVAGGLARVCTRLSLRLTAASRSLGHARCPHRWILLSSLSTWLGAVWTPDGLGSHCLGLWLLPTRPTENQGVAVTVPARVVSLMGQSCAHLHVACPLGPSSQGF